ncbi:SRPBCC family protein [Polluticoccus soli]|uniref:SRPBCC family protein n=1 Tax=Polluticoccus soli TaxID=3034150 RepID=UPI0023E1D22F|nr:SRPBCC family protein [Flavipsychrobacter sp. JY13-12]
MKQEPIIVERVYNAPAERVWKALTDKNKMKQWYFDIADFKPQEGFEFRFVGKDHDGVEWLHICTITEVIPNKKLTHSWRYDGYEGNSYVTWELFPEGDTTRVRLTHEGLETFPSTVAAFAKQNFVEGWTAILGTMLQEFVEQGTIKKHVEMNATAEKIWDVLTAPQYTTQWAAAFSEGTWVETDWKKSSEVIWKDKDGNIGARGTVEISNKASLLKIMFPDEQKEEHTKRPYTETYAMSDDGKGKATLSIDAGPLSVKHLKMHEPLWNKAIAKIKELAEQ